MASADFQVLADVRVAQSGNYCKFGWCGTNAGLGFCLTFLHISAAFDGWASPFYDPVIGLSELSEDARLLGIRR